MTDTRKMYFWLFKIRTLTDEGEVISWNPPSHCEGQNWAPVLHFIKLKQMNQKIKAAEQHIKVDKLRLKGLNCKKKSLELRGTHWQILILMLYHSGSPHGSHPQRGARPKASVPSCCRKPVGSSPAQSTGGRRGRSARMETMNRSLLKAALRAAVKQNPAHLGTDNWNW